MISKCSVINWLIIKLVNSWFLRISITEMCNNVIVHMGLKEEKNDWKDECWWITTSRTLQYVSKRKKGKNNGQKYLCV